MADLDPDFRGGNHLILRPTALVSLASDLRRHSGRRIYWIIALMLAAGVTEGIGLLMLLPMLALIGVFETSAATDPIAAYAEHVLQIFGVPLNLYSASLVFMLLLALRQWIVGRQAILVAATRPQYTNSIRHRLFDALQRASWRFVSQQRLPAYTHTLTQVSEQAGQAGFGLLRCLSLSVFLTAQFVIAIMLAPPLALLAIGMISALIILLGDRLSELFASGKRVTGHRESVHTTATNFLSLLRTSKFAGADDYMGRQFRSRTRELASELASYVRKFEISRSAIYLGAAASLCLFAILGVEVFAISGGRLVVLVLIFARFIPYTMRLYMESHRLTHQLPEFEHAHAEIRECLRHAEQQPDHSRQRIRPVRCVALRGVSIVLGKQARRPALIDVFAEFPVGSTTALIGPTGAGKSTLADILSGLIQPDKGGLYVDDSLLDSAGTIDWRRSVGYVPQDAALMDGSIRENLVWTARNTSDDDIDQALRAANAQHFVAGLPDGLDTRVGERGNQFSGGERQRLIVARELLRRPSLLILDEATNALDHRTAVRMLEGLRTFDRDLTIVLITHREALARVTDLHLRLDCGRVVGATAHAVYVGDDEPVSVSAPA